MRTLKILMLLVCSMVCAYGYAQETAVPAPDNKAEACTTGCCCDQSNQAPLGIMTDHIHKKGEWMLSYTYMDMMMQGNRTGTANADDNTVYKSYGMAPETMTMQMHMAMLMYGVTDRLTLMAMGGYSVYNMNMNMSNNMPYMPGMSMGQMTMQSMSSGFTDTRVSALYNFSNKATQRIIGSLGINMPTGTIMATGTTMLGDNQRVPYDMQPGTGSFGIVPGITYVRTYTAFSFGADAGADVKLNKNSIGYKDGNVYHAGAWAGYKFLPFVTGSLRAEYVNTGKITGSDPQIAIPIFEANDPTANTANYGGQWVNVYAGLNFHINKPMWSKFSLLMEYGLPVYQNLNGVQSALHGTALAGLQYSF